MLFVKYDLLLLYLVYARNRRLERIRPGKGGMDAFCKDTEICSRNIIVGKR